MIVKISSGLKRASLKGSFLKFVDCDRTKHIIHSNSQIIESRENDLPQSHRVSFVRGGDQTIVFDERMGAHYVKLEKPAKVTLGPGQTVEISKLRFKDFDNFEVDLYDPKEHTKVEDADSSSLMEIDLSGTPFFVKHVELGDNKYFANDF